MQPLKPILTLELFPKVRASLLNLLESLSVDDWERPTACEGWTVKDVALHLLGDDVGYLSRKRDDFAQPPPDGADLSRWDHLVKYLNYQNDLWVKATRRLSPRLLIELLTTTGYDLDAHVHSLDPFALGDPVSWAGPEPAPAWLDVAREYTERWLHQQHIRDAVNKPGLKGAEFLTPVLETFIRALPHTYRDVDAPGGTSVKLVISGEAGGQWMLLRSVKRWALYTGQAATPSATVTLDQETAWRLFTKGIGNAQAMRHTTIEGDRMLGRKVLDVVSIIA